MKPISLDYKIWSYKQHHYGVSRQLLCSSREIKEISEDLKFVFGKPKAPLVKIIHEFSDEKNLSYKFYFDNLFTYINLLNYQSGLGYGGTSTMREDHIPGDCILIERTKIKNYTKKPF